VRFNSYEFILEFLPATLVGFFLLRDQRIRLAVIVVASYVFYAHEQIWFPALMAASTLVSYIGGIAVAAPLPPRARRVALTLGVGVTLSFLLYFKYAAFGAHYVSRTLAIFMAPGLPSFEQFARGIVLPVGISFYTFEGISYVVDVYRRELEAERNLLRYATFISFFPHLIAGPIVRYGLLRPQLARRHRFDPELFRAGLMLFSIGLVEKVLIADAISFRISAPLSDLGHLGFADAWLGMFGYSFQIYFDFAGYSNMALGLARMFGIELPWNFDRPYRSASPREFWRRWHVTLSSWLRDYIYIPLGGSRKGGLRRDVNLLVTMGLGGLWHGASLNFLGWGLYQGGLLVGNRHVDRLPFRFPRPLAVATTFILVTVGWVLFRLRLPYEVRGTLKAMAGLQGAGVVSSTLVPYLVVAAAVVWGLPEGWRMSLSRWGVGRLAMLAVLTGVAVLSLSSSVRFLYFQF
jgi:alginate O-acetyltransferase complex protein AlgI